VRAAALALLVAAVARTATPAPDCPADDPCVRPPRPGEVALVFLGDSGYGPGGESEWGTHAQGEVAARMEALCPRPDLVFFLGDNVYWRGSPDLFGPRFDTVYPRLLGADAGRRVHAALGNHDVKGCQLANVPAFGPGETCAHALERLVHTDAAQSTSPAPARLSPEVLARARGVAARDCPPARDAAYEQNNTESSACFATQALRHPAFGYGVLEGSPLRYYTVDAPAAGGAAHAPRVRVIVADSNTLQAVGGRLPLPAGAGDEVRSDRLQVLWLQNQLLTAPPGSWTFVAMHHPIYTPRGCAFKLFGRCFGGHGDEEALRDQLWPAFGYEPDAPAAAPDFVFAAHNHFYARTRAVGPSGQPEPGGAGIRHFVSGGGGAPLYRLLPRHARYAAAGAFHHFVYLRMRGEEAFFWAIDQHGGVRDSGCFRRRDDQDRCIARGTYTGDELVCGDPSPPGGACPAPSPPAP
jgi:hypothetical protein